MVEVIPAECWIFRWIPLGWMGFIAAECSVAIKIFYQNDKIYCYFCAQY